MVIVPVGSFKNISGKLVERTRMSWPYMKIAGKTANSFRYQVHIKTCVMYAVVILCCFLILYKEEDLSFLHLCSRGVRASHSVWLS
jgi:hypothetical protein